MADYPEKDYASQVVEYFENRDWEVYKEVVSPQSQRTVDIYAIQGNKNRPRRSHAVEVKTRFNLRVLEQAHYWRRYAERSSIAIPASCNKRNRKFGMRVCKEFGLGAFDVIEGNHGPMYAEVHKRSRKSGVQDRPTLMEGQKDAVAGTNDPDETWTPFDETTQELIELVGSSPGIPLEHALNLIDHHYKTKESGWNTLRSAISDQAVPELKISWHQSTAHLQPTEKHPVNTEEGSEQSGSVTE
jgi:hypothetical protein